MENKNCDEYLEFLMNEWLKKELVAFRLKIESLEKEVLEIENRMRQKIMMHQEIEIKIDLDKQEIEKKNEEIKKIEQERKLLPDHYSTSLEEFLRNKIF